MSLEIKEGNKVYKLNNEYLITSIIDFNYVFAKNTSTFETERIAIKDLASKPLDMQKINVCEDLSLIPKKKLDEARKRYEAIKPLIGLNSRKEIEKRAKELKVSPTTLYNWLRDYNSTGQLSSLVQTKIKGGKGQSRLTNEQDEIIDIVLKEYYLTNLKPTVSRTYEEVVIRCKNAKIKIPSEVTVRRRVNSLSEKLVLKKRIGKNEAEKLDINKKEYPDGLYPLHILQIDHTKVDIILVDDEYRQELGRPWITVAIDVYSRMVAGFYISFEAPGYFGTGQALYNAIIPKDEIKEKYKFISDWDVWGIPKALHMDNAKEFRGIDLQHTCEEYGIDIIWRPVARPRYGAHIERLLGTLNDYIHVLEATTFGNISERKNYNSEKKANMTLNEFEKWLTLLIADVYHKNIHSQLEMSPIQKYRDGIMGTQSQPPKGLPKIVEDKQLLQINLLPKFERTIQKYGIQLDTIYYYSEVLNVWIESFEMIRGKKIKRKFIVRRDPRDISKIWFYNPDSKKYYQLPYRNSRLPKTSIWEFTAAQKYLKKQKNIEYDENEIFEALIKLREIAQEAKNKTKSHRKNIDRVNKLKKHSPEINITHKILTSNNDFNSSSLTTENLPLKEEWFDLEKLTPFNGIDDSSNFKNKNIILDGDIVDSSEF
ncbi:Mu transposase C-terminal domain-containing protein [Aliarcobacter butzleri]|uniref:Mu transposase C-terminal domain-containing protein n=1 Tax=Aliarcobacter butzleri TaxID=28197 RepID=UPI002B24DE69|nr:Mu transposase C-terminal domain-containing protein [Aliarcobacter butzleri]